MQTIEFNHEWKMRLLNRFLTYVKIYSTSDAESENHAFFSTAMGCEIHLQELQDLGLSDVSMDENGYIMAYVPSNISENEPTVGFIAHYDTSPDFNGKRCKSTNLGRLQRWRFGTQPRNRFHTFF